MAFSWSSMTLWTLGAQLTFSFVTTVNAVAADVGAASHLLFPGDQAKARYDSEPNRIRIPLFLQSWNSAGAATSLEKAPTTAERQPKIPAKPVQHTLRARMEQVNDFYIGDWRIRTSPIRWLKSSKQYQVRLEVFRRYGEAGQVEESLGSLVLSGVLQKQAENLYAMRGSAKRRFTDQWGQPMLDLEAGTPATNGETRGLMSKAAQSRMRLE